MRLVFLTAMLAAATLCFFPAMAMASSESQPIIMEKNLNESDMTEQKSPSPVPNALNKASKSTEPVLTVLPNGLTVLAQQDTRFPIASIRLYVHAGSGYEQPDQAGISHFLEHMVFKGTDKRGPGESAEAIESVGGSMNAATSFDYTVFHTDLPSEHWKLGLDVLTDMAFHPAIEPKAMDDERKVVLSELERGEDNPHSILFKTMHSMVFKGTSYAWPVIGFRDTVQAITPETMKAYIAEHYQPQSILLVATGDIDPDEFTDQAKKLLGEMTNTHDATPPVPFALKAAAKPNIKVLPGKWNKVYMSLAFPVPGLTSNQQPGLALLAYLLGGDETSRLHRKFKYELRLVDGIYASVLDLERGGMFNIFAVLDPENLDEFYGKLMEELASLNAHTFTQAELERAKLNIEDSLFLAKETISGVASKLGYFQFFEHSYLNENNYLYAINQTDITAIDDLADKYLNPGRINACLLVPEDMDLKAETLAKRTQNLWPPRQTELAAKKQVKPLAETTKIDLPGGSTLVMIPDNTLPYTGISMFWTGGDGLLAADQQGLSVLTAKTLTRGTKDMNATAIEDFMAERTASLSTGSGRSSFYLSAQCPSKFEKDILELVRSMLTEPAWNPEEMARAKQDQISSIKRTKDQPMGLVFRNMFPFLFASGPYSYYHLGKAEQVEEFTAEAMNGFWEKQRSQPFVLSVCGKFDPEFIEDYARNLASETSKAAEKYRPLKAPWNEFHETTMRLPGRNQAHILAVFPAPGKLSQATAGLEVLKTVLAGQSGILFTRLREEQSLGYDVSAFLWQAPNTGLFAFYIGTTPDKVDQALDGFKSVVNDLVEKPLDSKELERAKNLLVGDYYLDHQTLTSRTREASSLLVQGFSLNANKAIMDKAKAVTPQDIVALARDYLRWEDVYIMKVLP